MINELWEYIAVGVTIAVALVGLTVGLLRGPKGKTKELPPRTQPPVQRPRGTKDHRDGTIVLDRGASAPARPQRPAPTPSRPTGEDTATALPTDDTRVGGEAAPSVEDRSRELREPDVYVLPPAPEDEADIAPGLETEETGLETEPGLEPEPAPEVEPASAPEREPAPAREPELEPEFSEPEAAPEPQAEPTPQVDTPTAPADRMHNLRSRLARSNTAIGKSLLSMLAAGELTEEDWEDVEDTLLQADLGVEATTELVDRLRHHVAVDGASDVDTARDWLYSDMLELVDPSLDRGLAASRMGDRPACMLVVGVNGTGKTTTVGKLARVLVANDRDVVLGAADTFRAAAADQLETWGARVGVPVVRSDRDGADPAAVAFDAVAQAQELEADCVIIDTAGRLHNKVGLMDELAKVKRVIEKKSPIDEVLLVIDATTGQNGLKQAEVFSQVVDVTGIVLTKLDGTAKGGIVVAVQRKLGVPVKLVGLGEGPDDLAPFDPEVFVDAIVE